MTTQVDVANMALDAIGAGLSITSLSPPAPMPNAAVVARHYQPKMDALARAAHWNFARKQVKGNVIKAAQGTPENVDGTTLPIPPFPWLYEYAYPADCLAARFLVCNPPLTSAAGPPIFPNAAGVIQWAFADTNSKFVVASDTDANGNPIKCILTDLEYADIVYTAQITNPDLWDPSFLLAAPAFLALWLVNPVNRNAIMWKEMTELVGAIVTQARISDGNEGLQSSDIRVDWMEVRNGAGFGYGPLGLGQAFYGWSSLRFPGGTFV